MLMQHNDSRVGRLDLEVCVPAKEKDDGLHATCDSDAANTLYLGTVALQEHTEDDG